MPHGEHLGLRRAYALADCFAGEAMSLQWSGLEIEEKKRTQRALAAVNAPLHEAKVPLSRKRLLGVAIACFVGAALLAWYVLFPLAWRVFR